MDTTTTQTQPDRTDTTADQPLDRVRIVRTPGACGGKPGIDGHQITFKHITIDRRLQENHWEIRPGDMMTRKQFKDALKSLEDGLKE